MAEVADGEVMAREAVRQFDAFCDDHRWVFTEVPGARDHGKDGYVDVSEPVNGDDAGVRHMLTGEMFAVQVKGGTSWRSGEGYRIPVGKHYQYWRHSSVPVVGIVWDPDDGLLRWGNLTQHLVNAADDKGVPILSDAALNDPRQAAALLESVRLTPVGRSITYGFGSLDARDQEDAVWDCFAIGRRDARTLVTLRRLFLNLDPPAVQAGLVALAHCTPHPDIAWTRENWIESPIKNVVRASMRWTFGETEALLDLVDRENGIDRGTLGQCVYHLLNEDPRVQGKLMTLLERGLAGWPGFWASVLVLYWAKEPVSILTHLEAVGVPRAIPEFEQVAASVREHGAVALF